MAINRLKPYPPIIGDDNPFLTLALKDVPEPYHFKNLVVPERAPLTLALKDRLFGYCEKYYRNYEIIGITIKDWWDELQLMLDTNVDNFEKFLAVYDDDIAKPVLGRERTLTHTESENMDNDGESTTKDYDLPIDNGTAQEVNRLVINNTGGSNRSVEYTDTEIMSDMGVTNNWEKLNGFLNENPTMEMVFRNYFKDCFALYEVMKW